MSNLPEENSEAPQPHEELVMVHNANTQEEADVVVATLETAGIPATLQNPNPSAGTGTIGESVGDTWNGAVYVAASNAEAARALLNAPEPTEEELTAEEEADPTTLEAAEARVKDL